MNIPAITTFQKKQIKIIILTLFLVLSLSGLLLHFTIKNILKQQFKEELFISSIFLEQQMQQHAQTPGQLPDFRPFLHQWDESFNIRISLIDTTGTPLVDSHIPNTQLFRLKSMKNRPEVWEALQQGEGFSQRFSPTLSQKAIFYARLTTINKTPVILRLALPNTAMNQYLRYIDTFWIILSVLILLVTIVSIILFGRQQNTAIQQLKAKMQSLSKGELSAPLYLATHDELTEMAQLLNKIERTFLNQTNELQHEKEELNTILSSISEGLIAIDEHQKIIFYNKIALDFLQNGGEDIVNLPYYDVIRNAHMLSLIELFFQKPYVIQDEIELEDERILEVTLSPLQTPRLKKGCMIVMRDVTHFKKLEKIRRDFVANVSHEFKTPLAAIRGYAETLLDWALEDKETSRKYITKILRQSNQLENLVSDLLELARIEKLHTIELAAFDPFTIVESLIKQFQEAAHKKQQSLTLQWLEESVYILGEPEMFRSILANLLDNAVKYTPVGGSITVFARTTTEKLIVSVKDTGIGIPRKELDRIFERFYRVDRARSREVGGTGLGLSIVKHMAELQKATVTVESEVGKGSCFSVAFLRATDERPHPAS